jgi:hypothetical protein
MRLGSAIGMLLILANLLQGCALYVLKAVEGTVRAERARTEIDREIRARPVGDPGPIASVAMIPLGGSTAVPVEQSQTDSSRCEKDARMRMGYPLDISEPSLAKLATERYVMCMMNHGYQCANSSEHEGCGDAWTHPTATREQWAEDVRECRKVFWTTFLQARFYACMASKGFGKAVGKLGDPSAAKGGRP